jgi:hypothetical protein
MKRFILCVSLIVLMVCVVQSTNAVTIVTQGNQTAVTNEAVVVEATYNQLSTTIMVEARATMAVTSATSGKGLDTPDNATLGVNLVNMKVENSMIEDAGLVQSENTAKTLLNADLQVMENAQSNSNNENTAQIMKNSALIAGTLFESTFKTRTATDIAFNGVNNFSPGAIGVSNSFL